MQTVTLTENQMRVATLTGVERHLLSRKRQYTNAAGYDPTTVEALVNDILGAAAEFAAGIALNRVWIASVNNFKEPDVGVNIQVRTVKRLDGKLVIRPNDSEDDVYVLCYSKSLAEHNVIGWVKGGDGKRLGDWGVPLNRPGAWFVDQKRLEPI